VEVQPAAIRWQFPSLEDALANQREASPPFVKLLAELREADHATVWAELAEAFRPFVGPNGYDAPGEALLAVGTA
jgi:hypothetical protein